MKKSSKRNFFQTWSWHLFSLKNKTSKKKQKSYECLESTVRPPFSSSCLVSQTIKYGTNMMVNHETLAAISNMFVSLSLTVVRYISQDAEKIVRLLLENGADPDVIWSGHSPLSLAIMSGNDLVRKFYLMNKNLGCLYCVHPPLRTLSGLTAAGQRFLGNRSSSSHFMLILSNLARAVIYVSARFISKIEESLL